LSVFREISFGHIRRSGPSSGWWSRRSNVSRGERMLAARYRFEPPPTPFATTICAPVPCVDWIRLYTFERCSMCIDCLKSVCFRRGPRSSTRMFFGSTSAAL
jgi:hypothetical protein